MDCVKATIIAVTVVTLAGPLIAQPALPDFTPPSAQRGDTDENDPAHRDANPRPTELSTETPAAAPSAEMRGIVAPSQQVMITAPLDGRVQQVIAEEGQVVEADALLAEMDASIQRIVVEAAELQAEAAGEMKRAELLAAEARIMHERMVRAAENDAASEWEVRRTQLQRKQAEAQLQALRERRAMDQATLRLEQERLDRHHLRAPFAGRIVRVRVEDGATVAAGDPIVSLIHLDPLEAQISLPARMYGQLEVGRTYQLLAGEPVNRQLDARLTTVDPIIDSASRTFRCVFEIDNPDDRMPAGFTVRLLSEQ
jgi:RND family efflux transporter MFP subunit